MDSPRLSDRQLQAFQHTMDSGSVTAAASRMRIAQPGVTRLLKQLEHDLGFALFSRIKGRLVPTPEARLFYREQQRLWQGLEHLRDSARRIRQRELGGLGISAMPLLGLTFVPDVIAGMAKDHPDQHLRLSTFRSEQVVEDVVTQRSEIGFSLLGGQDERLGASAFTLDSVCLLPRDHPLARRESIALKDLDGQTLIHYEPGDPSRQTLERALAERGVTPRSRLEVSLALQATRLVGQGAGIAIVDALNARAMGGSDSIALPLQEPLTETLYLLTPRDQPLSRLAEEFVQRFRHRFAEVQAGQDRPGTT
ncbi:LysR substrate-binding domain-containing protein [Halomonas sp. H10-59]|uniref:LysR substrate-binding domain-containing protein n=1 Tax=Halomonas sp. H10-59 TaxID=2950874 RepID=A0AAU7KSQ7_9GAMM